MRYLFLSAAIIIFLTFLFYSGSMKNEFVWDDYHFIVNDASAHDFSHWRDLFSHNMGYLSGKGNNFYRPLYSLLNTADYKTGGGNPFTFHVTNTLLHAGVAVLACILVFMVSKNIYVAAATGLLFALHPVQTQAVTYIAGRADPMYAFFALLAIVLFLAYVKGRGNLLVYSASLVSFILSLLSKEAAAITPFLILLCIYAISEKGDEKTKRALLRTIPFFVILAVYILLRATVLNFSKTVFSTLSVPTPSFYIRMLTACKAIFLYFKFLLFPVGFHLEIFFPPAVSLMERATFAAVTGVILLITGLFYAYKRNKILFFALCWFFLALLPVLNLFPINAPVAVHWLYLPSMGFFFAITLAAWELLRNKNAYLFIAIFTVIAVILGIMTYNKNKEWRNEETLYKSILPSAQTPRLYVNLGNISAKKGEFDKAIVYYRKALQIAPNQTEAYSNLGYIYDKKKEFNKAVEVLELAVKLTPKLTSAHINLAVTYVHMGRYDDAMKEINKAVELSPNNEMVWNVLGKICFALGQRDRAKEAFERSLNINKDQPEIKDLLAGLQ